MKHTSISLAAFAEPISSSAPSTAGSRPSPIPTARRGTIPRYRVSPLKRATQVATIALAVVFSANARSQGCNTGELLSNTTFGPGTTLGFYTNNSVLDQWLAESATVAPGAVGCVVPTVGGLLHITETGGVVSQVRQVVQLAPAWSPSVAGDYAIATARFNSPTAGSVAGLNIWDGNTLQSIPGAIRTLNIDSDCNTWQVVTTCVALPPGTTRLNIDVYFVNGTIPQGGFVDVATLSVHRLGQGLINSTFVSPALGSYTNNSIRNQWLAESGVIQSGTVGCVSPTTGGLLHLMETGGVVSQARQVIELPCGPSQIGDYAIATACYDSPTGGSVASINVWDGVTLIPIPGVAKNMVLDSSCGTWQEMSICVPLPPGTTSLVIDVGFANGTIPMGGFVDAANLFVCRSGCSAPIYAFDLRTNRFLSTDTTDFVGSQTTISPPSVSTFAIDFDATATELWVIENPASAVPPRFGTIDLSTGAFSLVGTVTGPSSASGLTADPDGTTWWVSEIVAGSMNLWRGDIRTGVFALAGSANGVGGLMIDIACDREGNLIGHSITTDSFYSISPTGVPTLLGAHGLAANFAQGMDFDWASNTLYAAIYTGGGTGQFCSVNTSTGAVVQLQSTQPTNGEYEITLQVPFPGGCVGTGTSLGSSYCNPAVFNSTGQSASITASGSNVVLQNDLTLHASQLPSNAFGFFIASRTQSFVPNPGGSVGNLCLGGAIGRYVGPGQIKNSGAAGAFSLVLDLNQVPQPTGAVAVAAGESWNFQAWYRDAIGGFATSNFTDGYSVLFQ